MPMFGVVNVLLGQSTLLRSASEEEGILSIV